MVTDHDPEVIVGVIDTPHGGVEVPSEQRDPQGRRVRPHNQPQPRKPPCYAPVEDDNEYEYELGHGPKS